MLMTTVQLPGTDINNSPMVIHTTMINTDISLARVFQKNISDPTFPHGWMIMVKKVNEIVIVNRLSVSIMFRRAKIYNTNQQKFHVLQRNFKYCSFVVHVHNDMM